MLADEHAWWALREAKELITQAERGLRHEGDLLKADELARVLEGLEIVERALQNQPIPRSKRRFLG